MSDNHHLGYVKSFDQRKGWGFIECPETQATYGTDIFLLRGQILNNADIGKGDQVSFNVVQSDKGAQASNVQVLHSASSPDGRPTTVEGPFTGQLKDFNFEKGFGFIACDETQQRFGKDIFIMKSELPMGGVPPGVPLTFFCRVGDKGPQATRVSMSGYKGGMGGGKSSWGGGGKGYDGYGKGGFGKGCGGYDGYGYGCNGDYGYGGDGYGYDGYGGGYGCGMDGGWGCGGKGWDGGCKGKGCWGGDMGKGMGKLSESQVFFGTVKSIHPQNGWGLLLCTAVHKQIGKDVFVMKSNMDLCPGLEVGSAVMFNIQNGPKGPHGINLRAAPNAAQTFVGTVRSYNSMKGWGFVDCAESNQIYESDIFIHSNELNGAVPQPGEEISFTVDTSKGRPAATNIVLASGGAIGGACQAAAKGGYGPMGGCAGKGMMKSSPY